MYRRVRDSCRNVIGPTQSDFVLVERTQRHVYPMGAHLPK
jgi:hypothetical protein